MTNPFARQRVKYVNDLKRCFGALVGIAQGLICDGRLTDQEIYFLDEWLKQNDEIAVAWPGNIIQQKVKAALEDGIITEVERSHLLVTLQELIGGTAESLAAPTHVTQLAFDNVKACEFPGMLFCLTGDFVYGPRESCEVEIEKRGGLSAKNVTKALRYLVIGDRGSPEWKHGSFGTKIEKAQKYKRDGVPILIIREECWVSSLRNCVKL
jgi:NAD-dependent DNA ligase